MIAPPVKARNGTAVHLAPADRPSSIAASATLLRTQPGPRIAHSIAAIDSTRKAAMKPSSMAMRAWMKTVMSTIVRIAATAAGRMRWKVSQPMANTAITTAIAAIVDGKRQPKLVSPNRWMPAPISSLPTRGCSVL